MMCLHGQGERRGLSQCGHFADRGEGSLCDFVPTSFMDSPLSYYILFCSICDHGTQIATRFCKSSMSLKSAKLCQGPKIKVM